MDRCDGSCNTAEDPSSKICVPCEIEHVNLKVFNMIKGTNQSKTLIKYVSCEWRCRFTGRKCN